MINHNYYIYDQSQLSHESEYRRRRVQAARPSDQPKKPITRVNHTSNSSSESYQQ